MDKTINIDYQERMIRHGELLLIPIDELPKGYAEVEQSDNYIVAHSETGHHHVLVGDVVAFRKQDAPDIIQVRAFTQLIHQKTFDVHQTFEVKQGFYMRKVKQEFDYLAKAVREVRD